MHSVDLERAMMAVREAEQAIGVEEERSLSSSSRGRAALMAGDSLGLAAARIQKELAEWRQERLQEVRLQREMLKDEAHKRYVASRLQNEQMKHVVDSTEAAMDVEIARKMQAALDDRFLARRRWSDAREELRVLVEISSS